MENTNLPALVRELDRFDIFCPSMLYNYEHAQPFSTNIAEWKQFLERGGVIIGLDANYGQQVSWLTELGDGLALGPGRFLPVAIAGSAELYLGKRLATRILPATSARAQLGDVWDGVLPPAGSREELDLARVLTGRLEGLLAPVIAELYPATVDPPGHPRRLRRLTRLFL